MSAVSREYFGLPLYAWLAGAGAFIVGAVAIMRGRAKAGATKNASAGPINNYPTSAPSVSNGLPMPYPTSSVQLSPGGYIVDSQTGQILSTDGGVPVAGIPAPPVPKVVPTAPTINWHFGPQTGETKWWRWLPSIARDYGLSPDPQIEGETLDPNQLFARGLFPTGVPLAYSWQYGDASNQLGVAMPAAATAAMPPVANSNYLPSVHGWG